MFLTGFMKRIYLLDFARPSQNEARSGTKMIFEYLPRATADGNRPFLMILLRRDTSASAPAADRAGKADDIF